MGQQPVSVRQPGIGVRVLRVFQDGLFEKLDGLAQSLFCALVQVIPALQIHIVSSQIFGWAPGSLCAPGPFHFRLQLLENCLGNFFLNRENIFHLSVDGIRPKITAAHGIDQMSRDSQGVAGFANAAADDHRNVELVARLVRFRHSVAGNY